MTAEERVLALHARMRHRQQVREKRRLATLSALCAVLTLGLAVQIAGGGAHRGGTAGLYSGAMMLFEDAGGYVLLALAAFMAGVIITVVCLRQKEKQERRLREARKAAAGGVGEASDDVNSAAPAEAASKLYRSIMDQGGNER